MNRDELKEKIRQALRSKGEEFTTDNTAGHFLWSHSYEAAEACLSAIEQSGCTICPNEPTAVQMDAGLYQSSADSEWADVFSIYRDMLTASPFSSSPFNTQGDEVSCNRPEQAEQSVSPSALQTSYEQAASRLYERTKVDWDVSLTNSITEPVCCYVDIMPEGFPDMNADLPHVRGFIGVYDANQSILMACQHLLSQIEEPRSGDTDPST